MIYPKKGVNALQINVRSFPINPAVNGWAKETFAPKIRINDFHSPEFWFRVNDFHPPEFGFGLTYSVAQSASWRTGIKKTPKTQSPRAFTPFHQETQKNILFFILLLCLLSHLETKRISSKQKIKYFNQFYQISFL